VRTGAGLHSITCSRKPLPWCRCGEQGQRPGVMIREQLTARIVEARQWCTMAIGKPVDMEPQLLAHISMSASTRCLTLLFRHSVTLGCTAGQAICDVR
jgi:hypothetical protein